MHQHDRQHDDERAAARAPKGQRRGEPAAHHQQILALQRLAGNAAVSSLLSRERVTPSDEGRPIPPPQKQQMETQFGVDLSAVRIHDDDEAARTVGARAYTVGTDIVFGDGQYDEHRLAHELTHVVQQSAGPVEGREAAPGVTVSDPTDRHEREAEATADAVTAGQGPKLSGPGEATSGNDSHSQVQRDVPPDEQEQLEAGPTGPYGLPAPAQEAAETPTEGQVVPADQEFTQDILDRMVEARQAAPADQESTQGTLDRMEEARLDTGMSAEGVPTPTIGPQIHEPLKRDPGADFLATRKAANQSVLGAYGAAATANQGRSLAQQRAAAEMLNNLESMARSHLGAYGQGAGAWAPHTATTEELRKIYEERRH